jgi:hypothetical protein
MAETATAPANDTETIAPTGGVGANGGIEPLDTHGAASLLNDMFPEEPKAPVERPRGPDGKFLPSKPAEPAAAATPPAPDAEPDADATQDPEADQEAEPEPEAPPAPRLLKVKVDGMEQELPEDEVVKGYSRTADYTRKTQALAESRRQFETEVLLPTQEERRYYAERVAQLEEAIEALAPAAEPDWVRLRDTMTPEEFTTTFANWRGQQQRLERVRAERQRVADRMAEDDHRALLARVAQEEEKLKAALPEMADAEKGPGLKRDLIDYAKSLGFTDDDLAQVTDHRVLVLLNNSRLYAEAQRRKPVVESKVDRALEAMKPSGATPKPKASDMERARARLAASGSVEDAAALLNRL